MTIDRSARLERLLALLQCPECGQAYRYESVRQTGTNGLFGLLHCQCRTWPVLDSIPILADRRIGAYEHTTANEEYRGPTPAELSAMIRAGRGMQALLECLAAPVVLPQKLRRLPGLRQLSERPEALAAGRALRRTQLRHMLRHPGTSECARDWLWTFFGRWSLLTGDLFSYFYHRFCMPRYLAASAILSLIPQTSKPVLDVACGFGHLTHFLTGRHISDQVVGVDFNFYPMWAAQRTIAPDASFVLLDASQPLPFADHRFGAALCSDAFHLVPNKNGLLAEMRRVVDSGPLVFTRIGNKAVLPQEGEELTTSGYQELFGREHAWLFSEDDLVKDYLAHRTPDLSRCADPATLAQDKWLSAFLLPGNAEVPVPTHVTTWSHELDRLQLNPMYRAAPQPDGSVVVHLEFPGLWYALENARAITYMPFQATLSADMVAALRAGTRTPEIDSLIDRFVLLSLPERYAPDPLGSAAPRKASLGAA